ncbi:MAG TPA: glycosyltransferase [Solirubrobacteraceae bacterium]|jgi:GT2 family glycosyltransferase|nr:glycosyltransferase [Solirubrobacteraceae bacterium]
MTNAPAIAVAVASHERPARLARLLDALAEQTLAPDQFEVVVVHDSVGPESEQILGGHALPGLHHERVAPSGPALKRNRAWRASRAPLVAFTDDDCRPEPGWLAALLQAARAQPGAVVQGLTRPDPDEEHLLREALVRTQSIDPPTPFGQTCNILYPRALLERLGGFDETLPAAAGEDTDLLLRARESGAPLIAAPHARVRHAVTTASLPATLRAIGRWQHLAFVVRRHSALRRELTLGVFWKPAHAWLLSAAASGASRRPRALTLLLLAGWARSTRPNYGPGVRGQLRSIAELPLRALIDAVEVAVAARGALRYRTPFL